MIRIDEQEIAIGKFPDGTFLLKPDIELYKYINEGKITLTWNFENNEEMVVIMFITKHLKQKGISTIDLVMPYIPNARQDRVKNDEDIFTLKYFSEFVNSLGFNTVTVLDPHSYVSEALIDNIIVENPGRYIVKAVCSIYNSKPESERRSLIAFYPDEGAMKRYSDLIHLPYSFGIKKRDWLTGQILGLDVAGDVDGISQSDVLIIDDICSRGGTFYHSAKKLKELGANNIYLFVTHCENAIFDGDIFKSGLIDKVFTTNSIFNSSALEEAVSCGLKDKIEVYNYEKN